jgi:hypothetical protein
MTDGLMVAFLIVIVLVGAGILFVIAHGRKGGQALDLERYRTSWLQIERQVVRGEESSYHLAILNADKLLDQALRQRGINGTTMGERMKFSRDTWSNANAVWTAHKLRNQIAHEPNVRIEYDDTRRALVAYRQALKDIGAI